MSEEGKEMNMMVMEIAHSYFNDKIYEVSSIKPDYVSLTAYNPSDNTS